MLPILKAPIQYGKSFLTMVGDNGPDMNPKNYMNIMYLGRIWRDLSLTRLSCVTYPAGRSAYNPIEHAWSPLSNALTAVTIPACLSEEDEPPCKQNLAQKDKDEKNRKMLEKAANTLATYWKNLSYDGNPVIPIIMKENDREKESYHDHKTVEELVYASKKALDEGSKALKYARKEFSFFCKHADRRSNCFTLMKCQLFKPKEEECDWCRENPPKDCEAFRFEKELGEFFFDPAPSENHAEHFSTYLESKNSQRKYQRSKQGNGRCSICPNWWFSSSTEIKRHRRIVHPNTSQKNLIADEKEVLKPSTSTSKLHYCRFKVNKKSCDLSFPTYHQLMIHKKKMGHKNDRKRKAQDDAAEEAVAEQRRKNGQKTIQDIFLKGPVSKKPVGMEENDGDNAQWNDESKNSDGESENSKSGQESEEERCPECKIEKFDDQANTIHWIKCEH